MGECRVNGGSVLWCERGTRGCTVNHEVEKLHGDVAFLKAALSAALREGAKDLAAAEKQRDEALLLVQDLDNLVRESKRWLHRSTEWSDDDVLGPKWEAMDRRVAESFTAQKGKPQ